MTNEPPRRRTLLRSGAPSPCASLCLAALTALALISCAGARQEYTITDPYETTNRARFSNLLKIDAKVVRPVAHFYHQRVNDSVQRGINNSINNLQSTNFILNDLLQLRLHRFFHDSARLLINSTAGLLGLIDVAKHLDLDYEENDFGVTLALWGWRDSALLIVPVFGHYTVRQAYGSTLEAFLFHPGHLFGFSPAEALLYELLRGLNTRIQIFSIDGIANDPSIFDKYAFTRQYFRNSRILFISRKGGAAESEVVWSDEDLDLLD